MWKTRPLISIPGPYFVRTLERDEGTSKGGGGRRKGRQKKG